MDFLSPETRSRVMSRVRSENTSPELEVRRFLHRAGFRFRLHRRDLPGKPDIVFPTLKKAIFIHGCFWHQHRYCRSGHMPKSRLEYWEPKLKANCARDETARRELRKLGWKSITIWECRIERDVYVARLLKFLKS
ncbi:MAG: very short patch repair endonuclease [Candidatus Sulfotelmatobacter sp.]